MVWSGMNLISHILANDNAEEKRLLEGFLTWLAPIRDNSERPSPSVTRDHPDRIEFEVSTDPANTTWLYWREASYPNWRAYIDDSRGTRKVPIYRAGPGFMLMPLTQLTKARQFRWYGMCPNREAGNGGVNHRPRILSGTCS